MTHVLTGSQNINKIYNWLLAHRRNWLDKLQVHIETAVGIKHITGTGSIDDDLAFPDQLVIYIESGDTTYEKPPTSQCLLEIEINKITLFLSCEVLLIEKEMIVLALPPKELFSNAPVQLKDIQKAISS